jgi:two-component system, chemotaxis family, sensor kinase Cph1
MVALLSRVVSLIRVPSMLNPYLLTIIASLSGFFVKVPLTQLFQNLIGNAIKFSKPDTVPQVDVSVVQQENDWLFAVRADGIGIDPKYFDRIFEIFQCLHTRDEYPGTGIGLTLCKKIVECHHGKIWVTSALGEGATFSFTIPFKSIS